MRVMGNLSLPEIIRLHVVICGLFAVALISGCSKQENAKQENGSAPAQSIVSNRNPPASEQNPELLVVTEAKIKPEFNISEAVASVIEAFEKSYETDEDVVASTVASLEERYDTHTLLEFLVRLYENADSSNNKELAFMVQLNAKSFIEKKINGSSIESNPKSRKALLDTLDYFNNQAFTKKQWTIANSGYLSLLNALNSQKESEESNYQTVRAHLRLAVVYLSTRRPEDALEQCRFAQDLLITSANKSEARIHQIEAYFLSAIAYSEMGEAVEILAAAKIAKELLEKEQTSQFNHCDITQRTGKWLEERLSLLEGRAYTQLKRSADAYNSLRNSLPAYEEMPYLAESLTAQEAIELADYFGFLADAALAISKQEEAISAMERKLILESTAIEKTFRAGALDERIRATRDKLTRLYLGSGRTEKVAGKLVERLKSQQDAFLERAPDSQQLNEWIETLGQLARARLASSQIPQMALDFASALAMADALAMASEDDPQSEMAALPFEIELLQLDSIESYLADKSSEPSSVSPKNTVSIKALDDAAIELQERIAVRLSELAKSTALPFPARSRIVRVLLRRGDRLMEADLREALYTYQQARHFVSPEADQLYTETPALRAAILLRIGTIQEKRGDLANARTSLSSSLESLTFLPIAETNRNPDALETLALTHRQLGKLYKAEEDFDNAQQQFSKALEIAKTLWDTGGADPEKSENLASLYNESAEVALHFSQFDIGRALLAKEQELRLQLARYPSYNTPASQLALLKNYRLLMECSLGLNEWDECNRLVATAERALDRLNGDSTTTQDWHNERLRIAEISGMAKNVAGNIPAALECWRNALKQPIGSPTNNRQAALRHRELTASIWERIALAEESLKNTEGAVEALLQVYQRVSDNQPVFTPDAPPRLDPRAVAGRLANLYGAQNKLSDALRFSLIERDYLDTLLRQFPRHPVFILELQRINEKAAGYAIRQNLNSEARDYLDEALALNNALRERSPSDTELLQDRDRLTNMRDNLGATTP